MTELERVDQRRVATRGKATRSGRAAALVELMAWMVLAYAVAAHQTQIIGFLLTAIWGAPSNVPPAVLQHLAYVSPLFPLFLGGLALVRLAIAGRTRESVIFFSAAKLPVDLVLGVAIGAASVAITIVSLRLLSAHVPLPPLDHFPPAMHLYFATIGAVVPGIFEEIYFRGLVFRVGEGLPGALLVLIGAVGFAVWHIGTPAYLVHTFILGLIWAALVAATGRLAPSIFAHSFANAGFGFLLLSGFTITGS